MALRKCCRCGGYGLPIHWGMHVGSRAPQVTLGPDGSLVFADEERTYAVGGCVIPLPKPTYECADCRHQWGPEEYGDAALVELARTSGLDAETLLSALDERFDPYEGERWVTELGGENSDTDELPNSDRDPLAPLILGDPGLVIVTPWPGGAIEVAELSVGWHGLREIPVPISPVLAFFSESGPQDPKERSRHLVRIIKAAGKRRNAKFERCQLCGIRSAPEAWFRTEDEDPGTVTEACPKCEDREDWI